jgi:predicted NBD/HSP70 family sugar kinase
MKLLNSLSDINVSRILRLIWRQKSISRIEIASNLGLDKSTVTKIVNSLDKIGIITEVSQGVSGPQGGRRPVYLEINQNFGCIGGIEINPEKFICCLINLHGFVLYRYQEMVNPELYSKLGLEGYFKRAYEIIKTEAEKQKIKMIGVGLGIPALVDSDRGIIKYSIPLLVTEPLFFAKDVSEFVDVPITIENDARCCCFGEVMVSSNPHVNNMLFLLTEYRVLQPEAHSQKNLAIGIGLIVNGQIIKGPESVAGEFRSMLWEDGFSSQFFSGEGNLASDLTDNDELYSVFYELAQHIAFLVNTLNLQLVCIGGIDKKYINLLEELIRERIKIQWAYDMKKNYDVHMASFGSIAVAYGAASMFLEQLFSLPDISVNTCSSPQILEFLTSISTEKNDKNGKKSFTSENTNDKL